METSINWLLGRKHVEHKEARGLRLAVQTIEGFANRTFTCPDTAPKTSGIQKDEILKLIQDELPGCYDYTTRVKRYLDRKGIPQAQIEIVATVGLLSRYNPLDWTFHIASEAPHSPVPRKGQTER
jgi:hypothetical protein